MEDLQDILQTVNRSTIIINFSVKAFLVNVKKIRSFLRICLHLLHKSLMEIFIFGSHQLLRFVLSFNPFLANDPILYLLKTPENVSFFGVLRGVKLEHWPEITQNYFLGVKILPSLIYVTLPQTIYYVQNRNLFHHLRKASAQNYT